MKSGTKLFAQLERYLRLETADRLSVAITALIVAGVVFAIGTSAVYFLSMALVEALSLLVGSKAIAYLIVGLVLLLLIVLFLANKKKWVEAPVVRSVSESILGEPMLVGSDEELEDLYAEMEKGGRVR